MKDLKHQFKTWISIIFLKRPALLRRAPALEGPAICWETTEAFCALLGLWWCCHGPLQMCFPVVVMEFPISTSSSLAGESARRPFRGRRKVKFYRISQRWVGLSHANTCMLDLKISTSSLLIILKWKELSTNFYSHLPGKAMNSSSRRSKSQRKSTLDLLRHLWGCVLVENWFCNYFVWLDFTQLQNLKPSVSPNTK